jgi:hypothetical protein
MQSNISGSTTIQVLHPWVHSGTVLTPALSPVTVSVHFHGIWCLEPVSVLRRDWNQCDKDVLLHI